MGSGKRRSAGGNTLARCTERIMRANVLCQFRNHLPDTLSFSLIHSYTNNTSMTRRASFCRRCLSASRKDSLNDPCHAPSFHNNNTRTTTTMSTPKLAQIQHQSRDRKRGRRLHSTAITGLSVATNSSLFVHDFASRTRLSSSRSCLAKPSRWWLVRMLRQCRFARVHSGAS